MCFFKQTWRQSQRSRWIRNFLFFVAIVAGLSFGICHLLGFFLVEGLSYKSPYLNTVKRIYGKNPALFKLVKRDTLAEALSLAISRQESQFARLIMDAQPDLKDVDFDSYLNPLVIAAFSSDKEMTLELIARGFNYSAPKNAGLPSTSPLLAAAYMGGREVVEALINSGYSFNETEHTGSRAFEIAIGRGHTITAEFLLSVELGEALRKITDEPLKKDFRKAVQMDLEYLAEKRRNVIEHASSTCLIERAKNTLMDCFAAVVKESNRKTPIFDLAYLAILRDLGVKEAVLNIDEDWDYYLLSYSIEYMERTQNKPTFIQQKTRARPKDINFTALSELEKRWNRLAVEPVIDLAKTRFYWALDDHENPNDRNRAPASIRRGYISRGDWLNLKHRTEKYEKTHNYLNPKK